jgi:hypothetical protein
MSLSLSSIDKKVDGFEVRLPNNGLLSVQPSPIIFRESLPRIDGALVSLSLSGDQDIGAFQRVLSAIGLGEALKPLTIEDLETIKLRFLFKFFYPGAADELKKDSASFAFSIDQLKQKIFSIAPLMENYWKEYTVQPMELWPGYIRYFIPIEQKINSLGARALTAVLTRSSDGETKTGELPYHLGELELNTIVNIIKNGMLSEKIRKSAGISTRGLGGDGGIYTQMIWKEDVESQKSIEELGYSKWGTVRLFFSLSALNRGSYQYNRCLGGRKHNSDYKVRKNLFDFMTYFPFWRKEARKKHEIMLPKRILPEEVQGVSVPAEHIREQIFSSLRKYNLIHTDNQGNETINNMPIREFVTVSQQIPKNIIDRC